MYYIGIDLGGTNIAAGITDTEGNILYKGSLPTGASRGRDAIIDDICDAVDIIEVLKPVYNFKASD